MINTTYIKNFVKVVEGYQLEITPTGTVYSCTSRGKVKLDSLWIPKIGVLSVYLPEGKEVKLNKTKDGLKTETEIQDDREQAEKVRQLKKAAEKASKRKKPVLKDWLIVGGLFSLAVIVLWFAVNGLIRF